MTSDLKIMLYHTNYENQVIFYDLERGLVAGGAPPPPHTQVPLEPAYINLWFPLLCFCTNTDVTDLCKESRSKGTSQNFPLLLSQLVNFYSP